MGDDRSKRDANANSEKPLPSPPSRPGKSGIEAEEITPYRDRPSHDGKYGDAADEPVSGYPDAAPETERSRSR